MLPGHYQSEMWRVLEGLDAPQWLQEQEDYSEEYHRLDNRVTGILQQHRPVNENSLWVGLLKRKQQAVACARPRPASLALPTIATEMPSRAQPNSSTQGTIQHCTRWWLTTVKSKQKQESNHEKRNAGSEKNGQLHARGNRRHLGRVL